MSGRCRACDVILNEYEMTRKYPVSGEYYDLCSSCSDCNSEETTIVIDGILLGSEVEDINEEFSNA